MSEETRHVDVGRAFPVVKGTWTADAEYEVMDIVSYSGSGYIAKQNVPEGIMPGEDEGEYWCSIAATGVAATIEIGSVSRISAGSAPFVINSGDEQNAVLNFGLPEGNGIDAFQKTGTSGLIDTYRVTFTDPEAPAFTFQVKNGRGMTSVEKASVGLVDTYTITYNDGSIEYMSVTNGRGVVSVEKSSAGLVDTYTITYNDGSVEYATVTNGQPCTHSWNGTTLTITSASGTSSSDLKGQAATVAAGTVTTLPAGSFATVTNSGTSGDAIFNFGIPQGEKGDKGDQGDSITAGGEWDNATAYDPLTFVTKDGAAYISIQSVPAGTAVTNTAYWMKSIAGLSIGTVSTVAYDAGASATITGTPDNPVLNLDIPRGVTGNESIDDTAGEGDDDVVWSASRSWSETNCENLFYKTLFPNFDGEKIDRISTNKDYPFTSTRATLTNAEHGVRFTNTTANRAFVLYLGQSASSTTPIEDMTLNGFALNEYYTFSCDISAKISKATNIRIYSQAYDSSKNLTQSNGLMLAIDEDHIGVEVQGGRVSYTFKFPVGSVHAQVRINIPDSAQSGLAVGDYIELRNMMLQKGKYATVYKPNISDFEIDSTLTLSGKAADSKSTGDYIRAVDSPNLMLNTLHPGTDTADRPLFNGDAPLTTSNGTITAVDRGIRVTSTKDGYAQWLIFGKTFSQADLCGLEPGAWYTLSFDIKARTTVSGNQNIYYQIGYEDGLDWESYKSDTVLAMEAGDNTGHVVYQFQVKDDIDKLRLLLHAGSATAAEVVAGYDYTEITNIMLQKGKIATEYKPNVQDFEKIIQPVWWKSDGDITTKIQQLTKKTRISESQYGTAPFCMIHFSDIHGDGTRLKNVIAFKEHFGEYIQDILHTGDIVRNVSTDGLGFWNNVEGAENILNCIGNHDTRTSTAQTTEAWLGLTMAECYNMYFAPYVDNWDVEIESGKTYYYKDYGENDIRLIVLDAMHERNNTEMLEWFAEALEGARLNGLHVIAASHVKAHWDLTPYDTTWDDFPTVPYPEDPEDKSTTGALYPLNLLGAYAEAVDDFIDAGGNFVCWLHGHLHYRYFSFLTNYPRQLNIAVASDNLNYENNQIWLKVAGTKSEDDFNVVGVDTYAKILRIVKVGVNYDRMMRHVDTISYNYGTHELLYSA